jgi:alanine dehydrogenase
MVTLSSTEVARLLPYPALRNALAKVLASGGVVPNRTIHHLDDERLLGLMPAWRLNGDICVKIAVVVSDNATRDLPVVQALVVVFHRETGQPIAVLDGTEVTLRRTAATSSLAASFLARADASRYGLLGCGALALPMVEAMTSVRPIREVRIWGRSFEKAQAAALRIAASVPNISIEPVETAQAAASGGDILSTITSASEPILRGEWIRHGTHVDIVGSHSPDKREVDDAGVRDARIFVDFRESALVEAGDILIPLRSGAITPEHLIGDLRDLLIGEVPGRRTEKEITMFKSVGNGLEDLIAAETALHRLDLESKPGK